MTPAVALSPAARNAAAAAVVALVDAAPAPGAFAIHDADGRLLALATCPVPAFAAPVDGSAQLATPITNIPVIADGKPASFTLVDGLGNEVLRGTAGKRPATADDPVPNLAFTSVDWSAGDAIDLANYTHTQPAS